MDEFESHKQFLEKQLHSEVNDYFFFLSSC